MPPALAAAARGQLRAGPGSGLRRAGRAGEAPLWDALRQVFEWSSHLNGQLIDSRWAGAVNTQSVTEPRLSTLPAAGTPGGL